MTRTIPASESLTVEFKSDKRGLPDRDLVLAVVAMANTDGGMIYLGVEDSGQVTGLLPQHRDANGLAALVANRTVPPISLRVTLLEEEGHTP
jgi:ATP-dependent DNA helicase RecG